MVFAVRDLFRAGLPVPADTVAPSSGPLYEYVGRRLVQSFDLPSGPMKYFVWMAMPDADTNPLGLAVLNRGVGSRTVDQEWPQIRRDLDAGHLSCLALVCTRSHDPMDLGENHQVLAWRYPNGGRRRHDLGVRPEPTGRRRRPAQVRHLRSVVGVEDLVQRFIEAGARDLPCPVPPGSTACVLIARVLSVGAGNRVAGGGRRAEQG